MRKRILQLTLIYGAWTVVAVLWATHEYIYSHSIGKMFAFRDVLWEALLDHWTWATFTPFVLYAAKRFPITRQRLVTNAALHLGFCTLLCWLHVIIAHYEGLYPHGKDKLWDDLTTRFVTNLYSDLWMYWPLVLIWSVIDYQRRYRERDRQAAHLETQLTEQRLQSLRNQLQPHFLFNTLNSIASLVHEDVDAADDMIVDLSCMLRYSLQEANAQEISLRHELELLDCYLRIQRHRFGDRLQASVRVPTELLSAAVPSLLLQPLAENAIEHGLKDVAHEGVLDIEAFAQDGTLNLRIEDNGAGIPHGNENRERIGIGNARARLRGLYGDQQSFTVANRAEGGAVVLIRIPHREYHPQAAGLDRGRRAARAYSADVAARP